MTCQPPSCKEVHNRPGGCGLRGAWRPSVAYRALMHLLDLLAPPRCAACSTEARAPFCGRCLAEASQLELPDRGQVRLVDGVLAVGLYAYLGPVAAALRGIKAGSRHAAAIGLGRLMRARLGLDRVEAVLTWVPSSPRRLRERGEEVPKLLAGPGAVRLLRRIADRPDQTTLDRAARRVSPWGSFAAVGRAPPVAILVDDVRTTGATAAAAAAVLRQAGARRVLVATLAVARPPVAVGWLAERRVMTGHPRRAPSGSPR